MKQHQYAGGKCIYCGSPQPVYNGSKPVGLSSIKYERKSPKKRVFSEFQYNTQLLIDCLGVPVKEFARYVKYVKKLGVGNIHGIIKEVESADRWCRSTHHQKLNRVGWFINHFVKVNQIKK